MAHQPTPFSTIDLTALCILCQLENDPQPTNSDYIMKYKYVLVYIRPAMRI